MPRLTSTLAAVVVALLSACGSDASDSPAAIDQTFHLDAIDSTNLRLHADGTFEWFIYGCDFSGGDTGVWDEVDGSFELRPASGDTLEWNTGVGFRAPVTEITATPEVGGMRIAGVSDGEPFDQLWSSGGQCSICGEGRIPVDACSCAEPFEQNPFEAPDCDD